MLTWWTGDSASQRPTLTAVSIWICRRQVGLSQTRCAGLQQIYVTASHFDLMSIGQNRSIGALKYACAQRFLSHFYRLCYGVIKVLRFKTKWYPLARCWPLLVASKVSSPERQKWEKWWLPICDSFCLVTKIKCCHSFKTLIN